MLASRLMRYVGVVSVLFATGLMATSAQAAVGRTQGSFAVSPTGAATYNIPIWVPSGPKGIQPNLALNYSSTSGNGYVGPGWQLSGLSAIGRCNKTYIQDGVNLPVSLATADAYCLNGNRLRLTSGTYGADGSTYQTEYAEFSNITAHGTAGNGPSYFTVQGKDGLTYQYGNTTDSRIMAGSTAWNWLLNRVTDRAGNNYVISYSSTNAIAAAVPSVISYTPISSGSTSYSYTINFSYGNNSAQGSIVGYVAGNAVNNSNLLTGITVKSGSVVVKNYLLTYQVASNTSRTLLSQLQECEDSAGTSCLSPTTFTYQGGQSGVASTSVTALSSSATNTSGSYDFNGDGYSDLVYSVGTTWYVSFSNGTSYQAAVNTGVSSTSSWIGDVLGSGKASLLVSVGGTWYTYTWNGSAFVAQSTGLAVDSTMNQFLLTDVDGDGRADLVSMIYNANTHIAHIYVRVSTSANGAPSFSATNYDAYDLNSDAFSTLSMSSPINRPGSIMDLDGNGTADLNLVVSWTYWGGSSVITTNYYSTLLTYGTSKQFVSTYVAGSIGKSFDWNSDSCNDYVLGTTAYISGCGGSAATTVAIGATVIGTMDWDGDGRMDLLVANGSTIGVRKSTGGGVGSLITTSIPYSSAGRYFILDINGDGLDDLGFVSTTSPYAVTYWVHAGAGQPADLLSTVTDGYGVANSPTYVSIAQGSYTKGSGAVYPEQDIQSAKYVVSQIVSSDGAGSTYTKTYNYAGARKDAQGRGFSGFQAVTQGDSRTNTPVIKTYYKTAFPYTGMVYQQDVYQNNGTTLISHTVNTPSVINLDTTANNQRYFPYVSASTTDTYEVGGTKNGLLITSSTASFTYDNYGNVTSSTSTVTDKDSTSLVSPTYNTTWTKVVTNIISPNTTNWCLGIPTQTTVQQYATSVTAVTRTTSFTPDYVNCRITQSVVEPSSATYKVTTAYGYDSFGNVNSQTVTGVNMTARATATNWGTTGQFPINQTNPEGYYTQAGYNYNLGVQTSATDANGLVTSWTYDNFGRKLTETRPDSTSTAWSYNACASVSGGCQNGDPSSSTTSINQMVVIATSKNSSGTAIRDNWTYLDQFDRTIVTKSKTISGGYTRVGVQYNALGQAYRQTLPCDASSCTVYWATNTYDALGRVTAQSRPISATNSTLQTTTLAYQGMTRVVTDPQSKTKTQFTDPNGWLRRSKDHNGYYQNFTYDAFGSLKTVTDSSSNTLFSANYAYGISAFQTSTTDADLGTWSYTPNALGEISGYTDANGNAFTMTYDKLSRPLTRYVSGEGTTTWAWGTAAASYNIGQLASVTSTGGTTEAYTYDSKSRLSQKAITADGTTYYYNYAYNTSGLLDTLTYPTSTSSYRLALKYVYANGMLQQVKDNAAGTIFWQVNTMNPWGEITQETLGNGIVTNRSFDAVTGLVSSIQSGVGGGTGVQNEAYLFDKAGNVTQRQNNTLGLTENFYYDNLYRLDYSQLGGTTNLDLTYDNLGRITARSDVASNAAWTYGSTSHLHGVTQAGSSAFTYTYDANGNAITRNGQSITWSKYNYPTLINNSATENVTLSYDAHNSRWKQVYVNSGATETTYYIGTLMEKVTNSSATDYRYYIYGGDTAAVAVMSRLSTGTNVTRYVLDDHENSVAKITDSSGGVYVSESFTAYGNRRDAGTWSGAPTSGDLANINNVSRVGYTWQTALGNMGLIHMRGRVVDATTGRFLSADPHLTDPTNTQNYDRYAYVYNNPLSLTDPSGFDTTESCSLWHQFFAGTANAIGNAFSSAASTVSNWFSSGSSSGGSAYSSGGYSGGSSGGSASGGGTLEEVVVTATKSQTSVFAGTTSNLGWWNTSTTQTFCGYGCAKVWNGSKKSPFAPSTNTATNGQRVLAVASVAALLAAPVVGAAVEGTAAADSAITEGTSVYRVFGGEASDVGQSWTTVNPLSVENYRDAAGLFPGNSGEYVVEGALTDTTGITLRAALPGPGGVGGGLPEVLIPNAGSQVCFMCVYIPKPPL